MMDQSFLILLAVAGIIAIVLIFLIKKNDFLGRVGVGNRGSLDLNYVNQKWQEIEVLMNQGKPSAYQAAIIEADKLVDYVLENKVGTAGSMADRLKRSQKNFRNYSDYDGLWKAHKVRNGIAHQTNYEVLYPEVKRTISQYQKALKELKVL